MSDEGNNARPYPVLERMKRYGIPVTRENYIEQNWPSVRPDPWTVEREEELPPSLRDWDLFEEDANGHIVLKGTDPYAAESDDDTYPRL